MHVTVQRRGQVGLPRPIHLSSATSQWYTPPAFLKLVRQVFQGNKVDLDPCSDSHAQEYVQARHFYTAQQNGLSQIWQGRVFVNPPYKAEGGHSLSGAFFEEAKKEYAEGSASEVQVLLKAAVGYAWYAWFEPVLQWPRAWWHTRIAIVANRQVSYQGNPHGSTVAHLGPNTSQLFQVFQTFASIPGGDCWSLTSCVHS